MNSRNIRCKLCCVLISCSLVNPRKFLVSAQRSCPEDSVDRTQHTLSWLCWKSNVSVPLILRDLRGWRPVPLRWVMTIRSEPPMRSIGRLSPGSSERKMRKTWMFITCFFVCLFFFFLCVLLRHQGTTLGRQNQSGQSAHIQCE